MHYANLSDGITIGWAGGSSPVMVDVTVLFPFIYSDVTAVYLSSMASL